MRARHLLVFVLIGLTLLLSGCVGKVVVENMIITNQEAMKHKEHASLSENIAVGSVLINIQSHPWGHFGLNKESFREALAASLSAAKLLAHDGKEFYILGAHIVTVKLGDFGHTVAIQYSLIGKRDNKKIFSKLITSEGSSGLMQASRYEEAIRKNFAMLIDRLYHLKIGQTGG